MRRHLIRDLNKMCGHFVSISIICLLITLWNADNGLAAPDLCAVIHPSDTKIKWECVRIGRGETLETLFGDHWIDIARFNRVDRLHAYPGVEIKVPKDLDKIKAFSPMPKTYATAGKDPKFILVDQSEQFLGAYEFGMLVFSAPISSGEETDRTPSGVFRITAYDSRHFSSIYNLDNTSKPYPMHYALRFFISKTGISYWIHGRDIPGFPISHGCIGLYDEEMQKEYYGYPGTPVLEDAKSLFEWVTGSDRDGGLIHPLENGPAMIITGKGP